MKRKKNKFKSLIKQFIKEENLNNKILNENNIITFGKYKGKSIEEVIKENPIYIRWIIDNITPKNSKELNLSIKLKKLQFFNHFIIKIFSNTIIMKIFINSYLR